MNVIIPSVLIVSLLFFQTDSLMDAWYQINLSKKIIIDK